MSSVGREGPGLSPLFVTQRGRCLHHRACERLLEMTRPIAGGVGRARAGHVRPKKTAGRRLSWCAIELRATRTERTEESLYSGSSSGGSFFLSRTLCWYPHFVYAGYVHTGHRRTRSCYDPDSGATQVPSGGSWRRCCTSGRNETLRPLQVSSFMTALEMQDSRRKGTLAQTWDVSVLCPTRSTRHQCAHPKPCIRPYCHASPAGTWSRLAPETEMG